MLSQLKKLFSRAKMKEKDKKKGILKNAALKIICFSFQFQQVFLYGAFKQRKKKAMVLLELLVSEFQIRRPCDNIAKQVI